MQVWATTLLLFKSRQAAGGALLSSGGQRTADTAPPPHGCRATSTLSSALTEARAASREGNPLRSSSAPPWGSDCPRLVMFRKQKTQKEPLTSPRTA